MKLVARAPIEGIAGVVPDQRPGDTFECDAKVGNALLDAGKADEVGAKPVTPQPKEGHESKAERQVIAEEAAAEAAHLKREAGKGR